MKGRQNRLSLGFIAGLLGVALYFWWMTANYPDYDFTMLITWGVVLLVAFIILNLLLAVLLCLLATPVVLVLARGEEELPYWQAARARYHRLFAMVLRYVPLGI